MTNDLKNFLCHEEIEFRAKAQSEGKNGFLTDSHYATSLMVDDKKATDWLRDHDTRLINFVLDLVEKRLKEKANNEELELTPQDISTIINQLRV